MAIRAALLLGFLLAAWPAHGQVSTPVTLSQNSGNLYNSEATAATNTAVVTTITPTGNRSVMLNSVGARCSAGTASLTVSLGGATKWSSDAAFVGTTTKTVSWIPPLTGSSGDALVVTLSTCGVSNTGTLDVQADQK